MKVIFDIDGVLADVRKFVVEYLPHDWKEYFSHTEEFPCILPMVALLCSLQSKPYHEVYLVTGRPESNREATEKWLRKNSLAYGTLLMRSNGDSRPTCEVKIQWYREIRPDLIIDDDPAVVEIATKEGFKVLQVHGYRATLNDMIPATCNDELVVCPKSKECPYDGCQHHKPHERVWRHQVDCTNSSRSMAEECEACKPVDLVPA